MTKNEICIGAQGEVRIYKIGELPVGMTKIQIERSHLGAIISHSESGAHHILTSGCDILEHPSPPAGMRILYAILEAPAALIQDSASPHGSYQFEPGIYSFQMDREFNPFLEEARRSAD